MSASLPVVAARGRLALVGILALGLALRLWTIASGIPHTVGVDEPEILRRAVAMMKSGDFDPHFFDYGGLTIYFHVAVASIRFALGALQGEAAYTSLERVWEGNLLLWARVATALVGTLLVYVVYRAGLRWGVRVALAAALVAAVHPNLVRESHFALTDTPLTFFVALTLLVSLVAAEDGRPRWFAMAGVTAGLAAAVKYNGAVALLMPLTVAAAAATVRRRSTAALSAALASAGAFLLGAPYSVLDLPGFLTGFAHLAQSYNQSRSHAEIATLYLTYIRNAFGFGLGGWSNLLGWPALLLCAAGFVALFLRARSAPARAGALAMVVFTAGYFWLIAHQSLVYARYALPLAPMLALGLGAAVSAAADLFGYQESAPRRRRLTLLILLLPLVAPLWQAVAFDWNRRKVSTQEVAARWIERNIAREDPILLETATIVFPPDYQWDYTHQLIHEPLEAYQERGVKYLVSSTEKSDAARNTTSAAAAYRQLFASTQVVAVISPSVEHPGPTLTVLRVPDR